MKTYIAAFVAFLACAISIAGFVMDRKEVETSIDQTAQLQASVIAETEVEKPAATLVVRSGKHVLDRVDFIVSQFDVPKLMIKPFRKTFLEFLAGIDGDRPVGAFAFCEEDNDYPEIMICFPIKDFLEFKASLTDHTFIETEWGLTIDVEHDGTYFVKHTEEFVFASKNKDLFDRLPENPNSVFTELIKEDLVCFHVDANQIPLDWKERFWVGMKTGIRQSQANIDIDHTIEQAKDLVFGTDQFELRLNIDKATKRITLNSKLTGVDGSSLASNSEINRNQKPSRFSGFRFDKAAFNFHACSDTLTEDIKQMSEQVKATLEQASPNAFAEMTTFQNKFFELGQSTLDSGRIDFGATVALKGGKPNFAMGMQVPDEKKVLELIELAKKDNREFVVLSDEVSTHRSVEFIELTFPKKTRDFDKTLGPNAKAFVGIGDQAVYFAVGENALELVKRCIDKSIYSPAEIATLMSGQVRFFTTLRSVFGDVPLVMNQGNWRSVDRVTFESRACPNGYAGSVDIELGAIKACWVAIGLIGSEAEKAFQETSRQLNAGGTPSQFGQNKMVPVPAGDSGTKIPFSSMRKSY